MKKQGFSLTDYNTKLDGGRKNEKNFYQLC